MSDFIKTDFTEAIGYDCVVSAREYDFKASLEERSILVAELAAHFGWHFRGFFHDAAPQPISGEMLPGFEKALATMTPKSIFIIYDPEPLFMVRQDSTQRFRRNGFDKVLTERGGTFISVKELISAKLAPAHKFRDFPGIKAVGYARGWTRRAMGDSISLQDQIDDIQREAVAAGWETPIIYEDVKSWDVYPDPDDSVRNEMNLARPGLTSALSALSPNHVLVVMMPRVIGSWRVMNSFEDIVEKTGGQWVTTSNLYKRFKNVLYIDNNRRPLSVSQQQQVYNEKCWFFGKPVIELGNRFYNYEIVPFVASFRKQVIGPVCRPCTKLTEQALYAKINFSQYPDLVGVRITNLIDLEPVNYSFEESFDIQPEPFLPSGPPDDSYKR